MAADGGTPPSPSSAAADAAQASVLRAAAEGEAPRRRADAAEQAVEERAEEAVAGKAPAEAALEPKSQENNLLRMRLAAPQSRVSLLAADQLCKKAGALYEDALRQQAAELEGRQAAAADEAGSRELALTTRVAALERELREQGDLVRELRSRLRAAEEATELDGADTALRARVAEPRGRLHGAEIAEADLDTLRAHAAACEAARTNAEADARAALDVAAAGIREARAAEDRALELEQQLEEARAARLRAEQAAEQLRLDLGQLGAQLQRDEVLAAQQARNTEQQQEAERRREQHRLRGAHAEAAQLAPSRAELLAAREGVQAAINGVLRVAGAGRGAPAHGH
eukprot:TRINITY_DN14152_c0_g1_i4.p1 TRINITY_DN14152_c0_g1~~TRINITY_DN14152_c0_g1_i4.p1  ORF type:complete len:343 (+),score=128.09 TRINITY_DN14152_c0_g1_i4:73-1101(+)